MMEQLMNDVTKFHIEMDHPVGSYPAAIPEDRLELRVRLITEEVAEMLCAMLGLPREVYHHVQRAFLSVLSSASASRGETDLIETLDGACDALYVIVGTLVEYGLPGGEAWEEVQRANMAKAGGPKDEFGKTLKPEGWEPPDVTRIVLDAIERGTTREAAINDTYGSPGGHPA